MKLAQRQQALVESLNTRGEAAGLAPLAGVEGGVARGLQAYRRNAQGVAAQALAAVFPGVQEALGATDFEAMAWAFWRAAPPRAGDLGLWGEGLAGFLAAQPGMNEALVDQARLEWARHTAERAADAAFDAESLGLLAAGGPVGLRLRPGLSVLDQSSGPVLVWRQGWRAQSRALDRGDAAFLRLVLQGRSLETALAAAPEIDFSAWLQTALREGWLLGVLTLETD